MTTAAEKELERWESFEERGYMAFGTYRSMLRRLIAAEAKNARLQGTVDAVSALCEETETVRYALDYQGRTLVSKFRAAIR